MLFCQVQVMSNVWVWVGANIPLMTWLRLDILSTTLSLRSTIFKQIYIPFCSIVKIESHCFWSLSKRQKLINQNLPKHIFVNLLHFIVTILHSFWGSFLSLAFPDLCVTSKSIPARPLSAEIWCWSSLNPETLPRASTKRKWACHFTPSFIPTWHQTGKSGQKLSNFCGQRRKIQKKAVERTIPQRVLATASQAIISSQTQPLRQSTKSLFLVSSQTQTKISTNK